MLIRHRKIVGRPQPKPRPVDRVLRFHKRGGPGCYSSPLSLQSSPAVRQLRRFKQEAQAAAALNHPSILAVYGLGAFESSPHLVSELSEGETLLQHLRHGAVPIRKATGHSASGESRMD